MLSSESETPQPTEPSGSSDPSKEKDTPSMLTELNYGSKINGAVLNFQTVTTLIDGYLNACPHLYKDNFFNVLQESNLVTTSKDEKGIISKWETVNQDNSIQAKVDANNNCKEAWVGVLYKHYFRNRDGFDKMHNVKLEELKQEFGDKFDDDVLKYMAYNNCFPETRFKLPETGILYFKDYGVIASVNDALIKDRDYTNFYQGPLKEILDEIFNDDTDRRVEASQSGKQMQDKIQSAFEQKLTIKLNKLMGSFLNQHFQEWRQQQGALIEYTVLFDQTTHPMLKDANGSLAGNRQFEHYPSQFDVTSNKYDIVVTRMWSEIRDIYDKLLAKKGQTSEVESVIPQKYKNADEWNTYRTDVRGISKRFNNKGLQTPKASSWDGYDIAKGENKSRNNCLINRVFCMHYAWINAYRNIRVIELLCRRPNYKDKFAKKQSSPQSEGQGSDAGELPGMEIQGESGMGLRIKRKAEQEAHEQMLKRGRAIIEQCVANDVFALDQTEQEAREKAKEAYIKARDDRADKETLYELLKQRAGGDPLAIAAFGLEGYSNEDDAPQQKKNKKQRKAEKKEEKQRQAEISLGRASYSAKKKRQRRATPFVQREPGEKEPNKYYDNQQIKRISEQARDFQKLLSYYYIDSDNFKTLFNTIPVMESDKTLTDEQAFMLHSDLKQILYDVLFYIENVQSEEPDHEKQRVTISLFRQYCHTRNLPFWAQVQEVSDQYVRVLQNEKQRDEEEESQKVFEATNYVKGTTAFARMGPV